MAKPKNVQWKYQNNSVVELGYIKAELTQEDCLKAGNVFYVATVPEGSIVKGMTAYATGDLADAVTMTVDIGMNDCVFCADNVLTVGTKPTCTTDCECKIADQDYLVRVTLDEDVPVGGIVLLIGFININHVSGCCVEPLALNYTTTIVDPCTVSGCNDVLPANLQTTVIIEGP